MSYQVWPWRPQSSVVERIEWMTEVLTAYIGSEQRIRLRAVPRHIFEASILFADTVEASRLRVMINTRQHDLWAWPNWHEEIVLQAAAPMSAVSVYTGADALFCDFRDQSSGGKALLWSSPTHWEVVDIDYYSNGTMFFVSPTAFSFPQGASLFPLRMAKMLEPMRRKDHTRGIESLYDVSMHVVDNIGLNPYSSEFSYLDYDVLTDPLIMPSETMPREIERLLETLDPGTGVWHSVSPTHCPVIVTDHKWYAKTREQAYLFRRWLHTRAGRLNPIWIPSRMHDLVLSAPVDPYSNKIEIHDANYRNIGLNQPGLMHIAVFSSTGSIAFRKIEDAYSNLAGTEALRLDDSLGFSDVVRISFMDLHRFVSDAISLTWEGVGVMTCTGGMVTIPPVEVYDVGGGGGGAPE